jgi:hypothetical protein
MIETKTLGGEPKGGLDKKVVDKKSVVVQLVRILES